MARLSVLVVVLVVATAVGGAALPSSLRDDLPFNNGWRFQAVSPPQPPPPPSPPPPSAEACRAACCAKRFCQIWQWRSPSEAGGGCWSGMASCPNPPSPHLDWVGAGGRNVGPVPPPPPPPPVPGDHPPEAQPGFDDSGWAVVSTPHDLTIAFAPSEAACPSGCSGHSYIPRSSGWYRKHFALPADFSTSHVELLFEGVFRASLVYLNGELLVTHPSGYTSFNVRIDNATSVNFGGNNTLAVFADTSGGSGWWYEGTGIYRPVHLIRKSLLHIDTFGVAAPATLTGAIRMAPVLRAAGARVQAMAEVGNSGPQPALACVDFVLYDAAGAVVGSARSEPATVPPVNATALIPLTASIDVAAAELWSIPRPYLYTLQTTLLNSCGTEAVPLDRVNTSIGLRSVDFAADTGFFLNSQPVKLRGFCNHNDFGGVGMAVPDRLNLFRAQALRSMGANSWRMSHNPPTPALLDILDRIGVAVMDENRQFGSDSTYVGNMAAMVRRDRAHASVVIWSYCNEAGCGDAAAGPDFRAATLAHDTSRPTLANMIGDYGNILTQSIDVQGFSHRSRDTVEAFRSQDPGKPTYMSECCSCQTNRDENQQMANVFPSFNADCLQGQVNSSDGDPHISGTFIWTASDYLGESGGYPRVSSSFGALDLAGFPKASYSWLRSWWLLAREDGAPDKPFPTGDAHLVHIVQTWQPPTPHPPANASYAAPCAGALSSTAMRYDASSGHIIAGNTGLCLSGACANVSSGSCVPLTFETCSTSSAAQRFVYSASNGSLANPLGQGCLDLWRSGVGPQVGLWKCDGQVNQKWTVDAANGTIRSQTPGAPRCLADDPASSPITPIDVYTDLPTVRLFLNGQPLGDAATVVSPLLGGPSWAGFPGTAFVDGSNLTAVAYTADGRPAAVHTRLAAGAAARLRLRIDAPSPVTGTGAALLLDGRDAALVRAEIVDANGVVVPSASNNVSFAVLSGPGRILGSHNGDPACHEPNQAPWHSAYHGLVRAIVGVTMDAVTPPALRRRAAAIELDAPAHAYWLGADAAGGAAAPPSQLVVQASSPGLPAATIAIPLSTDPARDSVLAAAAASVGSSIVVN